MVDDEHGAVYWEGNDYHTYTDKDAIQGLVVSLVHPQDHKLLWGTGTTVYIGKDETMIYKDKRL